jgi:uncharacterized membrane protein YfcA
MLSSIQPLLTLGVLVAAITLFFAGVVKGITGFGPALVAIPVLVQVFPPKPALTAFSIPLLISNLYMVVQSGVPRQFIAEYKSFILIILLATVGGVVSLVSLPVTILYVGIAVYILGFLLFDVFTSGDSYARVRGLRPAIGIMTGFLGGSVSMGGLPLATYLNALDLDKRVFATGLVLILLLHNGLRLFALSITDLFRASELVMGVGFFIPLALGVFGGIRIRAHISESRFQQLVRGTLFVSAIKLLLEVA